MKWMVGLLSVSTVVLGFLYAKKDLQVDRLSSLNALQDRQIELMRDECREYQFKITSTPTYEEGYKAALLKRNAGTYTDGFQDAKSVYDGSNSYALGYHAALDQFGFLKDLTKDTAQKIKQQEENQTDRKETY